MTSDETLTVRITVEPYRSGWAVIIAGPGRLPSRVAWFPAQFMADAHAAWLRGEQARP